MITVAPGAASLMRSHSARAPPAREREHHRVGVKLACQGLDRERTALLADDLNAVVAQHAAHPDGSHRTEPREQHAGWARGAVGPFGSPSSPCAR